MTNPLFGENGAAAVYGPQKGMKPDQWDYLEREGKRLADALCRYFDNPIARQKQPGAGAAGGIGFGLMVAAGATLVPGFELVTAWLQLEQHVRNSDLIITGEGKFDDSSLHGKGPFAVIEMAAAAKKERAALFAGVIEVDNMENLRKLIPRFTADAIAHPDWPLERNLKEGPRRLAETIRQRFGGHE